MGRKEISAISGFLSPSPAPGTLHRSQLISGLRGHHGDALCHALRAPGALLLLWPLGVKVQPLHGHRRFCESGALGTYSPEDLGRNLSPALETFAFFSPTLQGSQHTLLMFGFFQKETVWGDLQLWPGHDGLPEQERVFPEPGSQKYRTKLSCLHLAALPSWGGVGAAPSSWALPVPSHLPFAPPQGQETYMIASPGPRTAPGALVGTFHLFFLVNLREKDHSHVHFPGEEVKAQGSSLVQSHVACLLT